MSHAPGFVFCADDFTGACDTLATLVRRGHNARLYLRCPGAEGYSEADDLDAMGVAAPLRSMPRDDAVERMRRIAMDLVSIGASFYHLKICSTFDSASHTGNIAAIADVFAENIGAAWTAVIGGQPSLGRYCLFGNLFAAVDGVVHRIDRHPVMRAHPVTPMDESDLRLHLRRQGWKQVGLVPFTTYQDGVSKVIDVIQQRLASGERQTLFDVSCANDLAVIGAALRYFAGRRTILCVGASSVVEALYSHDVAMAGDCTVSGAAPPFTGPVFAFAGSRSSVTAAQVKRASLYEKVPVTPAALGTASDRTRIVEYCRDRLADGANVLAYLVDAPVAEQDGQVLAGATAELIKAVLVGDRVGCLAIAGGDTSSVAVERLGIVSLSFLADFDRGVPLACAHAGNHLDKLPVVLKGGQMGSPDFFDALLAAARQA